MFSVFPFARLANLCRKEQITAEMQVRAATGVRCAMLSLQVAGQTLHDLVHTFGRLRAGVDLVCRTPRGHRIRSGIDDANEW